jgi:L-seryl-tRNA(Ser) seleniumtransferase
MVPELANHVPHLMIEFDPVKIGASAREIKARLASATPAIELNPHSASGSPSQGVPAQPNALVVTTFLINPGEEITIGDQIAKALKDPKSVGTYNPPAPGQGGRGAGGGRGRGAGAGGGAPRSGNAPGE